MTTTSSQAGAGSEAEQEVRAAVELLERRGLNWENFDDLEESAYEAIGYIQENEWEDSYETMYEAEYSNENPEIGYIHADKVFYEVMNGEQYL